MQQVEVVWLEPVVEGEEPMCKPPFGYFIQVIEDPEILSVEWRNRPSSTIGDIVNLKSIGETVELHVYTKGLYGHNIIVRFFDKDTVSFNDQVTFSENPKNKLIQEVRKYKLDGRMVQKAIVPLFLEKN